MSNVTCCDHHSSLSHVAVRDSDGDDEVLVTCSDCFLSNDSSQFVELKMIEEQLRSRLTEHLVQLRNEVNGLRQEVANKEEQKKLLERELKQQSLSVSKQRNVAVDAEQTRLMAPILEIDSSDIADDLWMCSEAIQCVKQQIDSTNTVIEYIEDSVESDAISALELIELLKSLGLSFEPEFNKKDSCDSSEGRSSAEEDDLFAEDFSRPTTQSFTEAPRSVSYGNRESHPRRSGVINLRQPTIHDLVGDSGSEEEPEPPAVEQTPVPDKGPQSEHVDPDKKKSMAQTTQTLYLYNRVPEKFTTLLQDKDKWSPEPIDFALNGGLIAVRDPSNKLVKVFHMDGTLDWTSEQSQASRTEAGSGGSSISPPWIRSIAWLTRDLLAVLDTKGIHMLKSPGLIRSAPDAISKVKKPFLLHQAENGWFLVINDDNVLHVFNSKGELLSQFIMQASPEGRASNDYQPRIINGVDVTDRKLWGMHVTSDDKIVVSFGSHHYIHAVSLQGTSLWVHGRPGKPGKDINRLNSPWGMCNDPDGSILLADSGNNRVIKLDADGNYLGIILGQKENLKKPRHLGISNNGMLYVVDMDEENFENGIIKVYSPISKPA